MPLLGFSGLPTRSLLVGANSKRFKNYGLVWCVGISDDSIGDFVTRIEWNARWPSCQRDALKIVPTLVIIHHTVTDECTTFETCASMVSFPQLKGYCPATS